MRDSRRGNERYEPGGAEINVRGYGHCSDHVGETIRVVAVTKPNPPPDQLEDLLRRLIANMAARFRSSSGSGGADGGKVMTASGGGDT